MSFLAGSDEQDKKVEVVVVTPKPPTAMALKTQYESREMRAAGLAYFEDVMNEHINFIKSANDGLKLAAIELYYEHILGKQVQEIHTKNAHVMASTTELSKEQRDAAIRNFLLSPARSDS